MAKSTKLLKGSKIGHGVSLTALRKVLQKVQFNPKTSGPMKIVADQGNVDYYHHAAIVAIERGDRIYAMQLLALAELYKEASEAK